MPPIPKEQLGEDVPLDNVHGQRDRLPDGAAVVAPRHTGVHVVLVPPAHVEVQPRVVRHDAVHDAAAATTHVALDAPPHPARVVDGPGVQRAAGGAHVSHEPPALVGAHERVEGHVEAHVGDGQEVPRVGEREADVGDGVVWQGST